MTKEVAGLTVATLVERLFARWPAAWAEPWDRVGLSVGDPVSVVRGVACALDVTPESIREARSSGANVLLTHHPVCLETPAAVCPESSGASMPSSSIWESVSCGVALVAMHTNLDRSPEASLRLPRELGLEAKAGIERDRPQQAGSLGAVSDLHHGMGAGELAELCHERFGRPVRMYGDADACVHRVAFYSGSLGSQGCGDVVASGSDLVVCGEVGYHRALDLVSAGVSVIILGHDVSELPHVDCLVRAAGECGVDPRCIHKLKERVRWRSI